MRNVLTASTTSRRSQLDARISELQPVLMSTNVDRSIADYRDLGFMVTFRDLPEEPSYACLTRDAFSGTRVSGPARWAAQSKQFR